MITWCVAHTQPLKEHVAKQHLLDQSFEVYLPRFKTLHRHARKVKEVLAPLFPRYIFVGIDLEIVGWRSVNGTRGISYLLMAHDMRPASIPLHVIRELKSQEVSDSIVPIASLVTFTKGEAVRILEGPFKDQIAAFDTLDDKSRIHLLLSFLGRKMEVSLPSYAVEAA